jgi:alanine racemase
MIERDLLIAATGGEIFRAGTTTRFVAFASDSREVQRGDLFVAVRGQHTDGHDFAAEAAERGTGGVLIESGHLATDRPLAGRLKDSDATVIAVRDTRAALQDYAAAVLRAWRPRVLAVAGSAGKTTAKEAIATILSQRAPTFRSWRNYNDLLGVPLSLGRLTPDDRYAIIELGCDVPGELKRLTEMTRPAIGVVLNAHDTHLNGLGSPAGLIEALASLPAGLGADGIAVLNAADERVRGIGSALLNPHEGAAPRVVWFGDTTGLPHLQGPILYDAAATAALEPADHLRLVLRESTGAEGHIYAFRGLHGEHWRDSVLAALTVAALEGIPLEESAQALADLEPLPGRMRLFPGIGGAQILDDSHSAIPAATRAALAALDRLGRLWSMPRVAVLGDMTDLGASEVEAHHAIGVSAAAQADWLVTRGALAETIARAAREQGMPAGQIIATQTAEDAAAAVRSIVEGTPALPLILVKGAPTMRMEGIVQRLMADPARAPEVLDRQRSLWKREIVSDLLRPTWLEIDLEAIAANTRALARIIGPRVALLATLKADAYGHGAAKVARTVLHNGASWLGVATLSEATPLRAMLPQTPILLYGYVPPWHADDVVQQDLRATLYAMDTAQALSRAAAAQGRPARVHVKVDSGMGRLGLRAEDPAAIVAFVRALRDLPGIVVEGIYTHFANADAADLAHAREQLRRFRALLDALDAASLRPPIVHAANSAATLVLPEARFDLVRPGVALFGLHPSDDVRLPDEFRPALSFKTQIAQIKTVPAGEGISYGSDYLTAAPERLAVLPVGYADGFRRGPANWGEVLIRGRRAPIRGRVCMDMAVVSVDRIPDARAGDEVVLIGEQGGDRLSAEEVAARLGTINYEVVAALLSRVPRISD